MLAASHIAPAVLALLTLAACAPTGDAASNDAPTTRKALPGPPVALEAPTQEPSMACDAAKAQFAVGQAYGDTLAEQARSAADAKTARRLSPGQAVTMEYRDDRLNLETGADGRVVSVRCG